MSQLFGDVAVWATGVVYSFGYPGVAVWTPMSSLCLPVPSQLALPPPGALGSPGVAVWTPMASLCLPVPSQLVLPLAGFLVSQGSFSFPLVWLVATAGSSGASLVPYALGRRLGEERLRRFVR